MLQHFLQDFFIFPDFSQYQKIMKITSFDIEDVSDKMFKIEVVLEDGTEDFLYISKRSTEGN